MALRAIKDFPKATPSTEDLILIEQQGGGRSVSLKELPVSTPVEKKISDVQKDLNARITALAFEPGDTTGDAELRDIRNPADGFTVPAETNAGGAVRAQVTQLDEKISNLKGDIGDVEDRINPIDFRQKSNGKVILDVDITGTMKAFIDGMEQEPNEAIALTLEPDVPTAESHNFGVRGQICIDGNYLYVCVTDNTWKKIALQEL